MSEEESIVDPIANAEKRVKGFLQGWKKVNGGRDLVQPSNLRDAHSPDLLASDLEILANRQVAGYIATHSSGQELFHKEFKEIYWDTCLFVRKVYF